MSLSLVEVWVCQNVAFDGLELISSLLLGSLKHLLGRRRVAFDVVLDGALDDAAAAGAGHKFYLEGDLLHCVWQNMASH